jgi:hypothetical protein
MELTMSNLASAKWCDGSAVARTFRAPVLLKNFAFVKTLAPFQVLPLDSVAFVRRGSVSNSSSSKVAGGVQPSSHLSVFFNKVLRFWHEGQRSSLQLVRMSSELLCGSSLATKGDVLIHGPSLVARPVGSEWRNHHPRQAAIQTN